MARATKIMVIRHAEKPDDSGVRHGVTAKGERDSESLTIKGWQRAGAYGFEQVASALLDGDLPTVIS